MENISKVAALILAVGAVTTLPFAAPAQDATKPADPAVVETYLKATFGKAPPEWQTRIEPDETLKLCNQYRNSVPSAEAEKIVARELAKVVYPLGGKLIGDWREGAKIANNGRGGQFSDEPGTVAGGNCYACHQMEKKELSYGTLGPSLTAYGRDRNYAADDLRFGGRAGLFQHAALRCQQGLDRKADHRPGGVPVRSGVAGQQVIQRGRPTVIARLLIGRPVFQSVDDGTRGSGILGHPHEPVIGRRAAPTWWRVDG
jgi:sulfur-oxidizing protein SoxX